MNEKNIHPIVKDYLISDKNCIDARVDLGHHYVGKADAFGIKDIGGQYNSEVIGIAVEVKKNKKPFGKHIGQTLGYSLFSHRCYFAVPNTDSFIEEDIEMANKLGIGLLEIDINKKKCTEILTAKNHQPIEGLFLYAVDVLGYCKCSICKEFFKHNEKWSRKSLLKVFEDGRNYYSRKFNDYVFFSKKNERWPVMICNNCLGLLEQHHV